jgi:hypothetical protein
MLALTTLYRAFVSSRSDQVGTALGGGRVAAGLNSVTTKVAFVVKSASKAWSMFWRAVADHSSISSFTPPALRLYTLTFGGIMVTVFRRPTRV